MFRPILRRLTGEFRLPFIRKDLGENIRFIAFRLVLSVCWVFSSTAPASAQSHPGWWTVVPPESRSLVGIEWEKLRNSPFGDALRGELSTGGSLALPDLPCLMNAHDFLMASPPLLAAANGGCAPATLRTEAPARGLKLASYRGFDLWVPSTSNMPSNPGASALSVLQFNERVVVIGSIKSLRSAIDRNLSETRTYSPLLIQGARLARTRDLWAVATELPDPLASIFVPLEVTAGSVRNFEGGITLREGLDLGAILDAGSEAVASEVAAGIRKSIPQFSAVAKGLRVETNGSSVTLALQVANDELQSSLRRGEAEGSVASDPPATLPAPLAPKGPAAPAAAKASPMHSASKGSAAPPASKPLPAPTAPSAVAVPASTIAVDPAKAEPQIIRIYGLDEGTREIRLPPKQP